MYYHHDGEIEYIAVKPKYQSKGFGSKIIRHALMKINEDSINTPYLYCVDINVRGLKFYQREGFVVTSRAARIILYE